MVVFFTTIDVTAIAMCNQLRKIQRAATRGGVGGRGGSVGRF